MRLPFFRAKSAADEPPKPARAARGRAAAAAAAAGINDEAPLAARTQARRRLIGALVLLVAGVVGFPVLFETQPRPLPVDTPYLVGEGAGARGAQAPAARPRPSLPADAGSETPEAAAPEPGAAASAGAAAAGAMVPAAASVPPAATPVKASPVLAEVDKPQAKPATPRADPPKVEVAKAEPAKAEPAKVQPVKAEPAKAEAAKPPLPAAEPAPAPGGRFVVQVGAYNDVERMRAARQKLEKMGFKSYTQDVETAGGKRTRVRVGPFTSRQEADAVATKVKASGMQANILAL